MLQYGPYLLFRLTVTSKVSHLASKKIDNTLRKKLSRLENMIIELKTLIEAPPLITEAQSLFGNEADNGQASAEIESPTQSEFVRVDSASSICESNIIPEGSLEESITPDVRSPSRDATEQLGDEMILQCAQETLSRATSLYEASVHGERVGESRSADRRHRLKLALQKKAPPNSSHRSLKCVELLDIPDTQLDGLLPLGFTRARKSNLGVKIETKPVPLEQPLNMPSQIQESFQKLQYHIRQRGPSIAKQAAEVVPIASPPTPSDLRRCHLSETSDLKEPTIVDFFIATSNLWKAPEGAMPISSGPSTPYRYVGHIHQDLQYFARNGISSSRSVSLQKLLPEYPRLLPTNRVALTGRLGIGKTYLAAAHVFRLLQRFPSVAIFWFSEACLEDDCRAVTKLLGFKAPTAVMKPWKWLSKILSKLHTRVIGPWLVVLDGVNFDIAAHKRLKKQLNIQESTDCYILMTTRHVNTAKSFVLDGLTFNVEGLDGEDAANLLTVGSPIPRDYEYDVIAQALNYDPFVIKQVQSFLETTKMSIRDFGVQLEIILNDENWSRGGQATAAAKVLSRFQRLDTKTPSISQSSHDLTLAAVMSAVINPSWPVVFDALDSTKPEAMGLLSIISLLGKFRIPLSLLSDGVDSKAAAHVLSDQSLLVLEQTELSACQLMLVAHKVWLLEQDKMERACAAALKWIANLYPDVKDDSTTDPCKALEPFARAVLCHPANSWITGDTESEDYMSRLRDRIDRSRSGKS